MGRSRFRRRSVRSWEDSRRSGRNVIDTEKTPSRKKEHVDLCLDEEVRFRGKGTGLDLYELEHNALPEIDFASVDTSVDFLGRRLRLPFLISSMTGGYDEAERLNRGLAEACEATGIALGLGSQRQALESDRYHESWRTARKNAPSIPIFGNIGAVEIARGVPREGIMRLVDLIEADGFAVHLNPLQELMQPEGETTFAGVLEGIAKLVRDLPVPVIVKEVGAGLSADVVRRLIEVGVRHIDISGAGGTSWSGVELLRREEEDLRAEELFWDWGIPTSEALIEARPLCDEVDGTMIASGGVASARDMGVCFPLGATIVGAARPFLARLRSEGVEGLCNEIERWGEYLRMIMFLTGSPDISGLRRASLRRRPEERIS